jgi:ribosomal protein L12E/L44/L45/RPP1/RPP2
MQDVHNFFLKLKSENALVYDLLTTNGQPDSQKLRSYLIEHNIASTGSTMVSLVRALSSKELSKLQGAVQGAAVQGAVQGAAVQGAVQGAGNEQINTQKNPINDNTKSLLDDTIINKKSTPTETDKEKKTRYTIKSFTPDSIQCLSLEFEILQGVFKAGRADVDRMRALEDAHVKCDQALDWIVEVKNTSDDFSAILSGVQYAADTPSLANALYNLYLELF